MMKFHIIICFASLLERETRLSKKQDSVLLLSLLDKPTQSPQNKQQVFPSHHCKKKGATLVFIIKISGSYEIVLVD